MTYRWVVKCRDVDAMTLQWHATTEHTEYRALHSQQKYISHKATFFKCGRVKHAQQISQYNEVFLFLAYL